MIALVDFMQKNKRIFVGPFEIAGYYRNLCEGFRLLGVSYDFVSYEQHPFQYGGETKCPYLLRLARRFNKKRGEPGRSLIVRAAIAFPGELLQLLWSLYAIFRYDVFIFGFGSSLLRDNLDFPLLRMLGKIVISNLAHGAEARPPFIDGAYQSESGDAFPQSHINKRAISVKLCMQRHAKYSNHIIGAPFSTTQFASCHLINSFAIGLPFDASNSKRGTSDLHHCACEPKGRAVRILHSPSHSAVKGSALILKAIDNLKQRGYEIDFILMKGRLFSEVLAEIERCDFVVDQLYSDTPMAGFATEAAWFGKPAIVGGYGLDRSQLLVPEGMWPPSKICHPDQIEQAIEELIVDVEQREKLGLDAQAFVRQKWNPVEVAKRYMRIIDGEIPNEWWLDPHSVVYLEGCGQPVERTKECILGMVKQFGIESLQLSHRPDLEKAFLEFAGITREG